MKKKIITIIIAICVLISGLCVSSYALNTKHYKIMRKELRGSLDMVQCIDRYKKWYCYYVYANGDIYVITINKNKLDICQQLN